MGYHEQKYRVSILVHVLFSDGTHYTDHIKGLNKGHAMYLARLNWEGDQVTFMGFSG